MLNPPQDEPPPTGSRRTVALTVVGVVVAVAAVAAFGLTAGGDDEPAAAAGTAVGTAVGTTPADLCSFPADGTTPAVPVSPPTELDPPVTGRVLGELTTSAGPIPLTLDRGLAPCTVDSTISLAQQGFYDEAPCHRLTTATIFVLQCGDPTGTGRGGPGYTVPDELPIAPAASGVYYPRGTVAMANTGEPDTGGGQFFLVYADSPLSPEFTVFGTVGVAGLATLDSVAAAGTIDGSTDGAPAVPVVIQALTATS